VSTRSGRDLRSGGDHLLVAVQLLDEGALMEQRLQPLLGVVVAELLEGGATLPLSHAGVLEARRVHDEQRTQRVLAGLQCPAEDTRKSCEKRRDTHGLQIEAASPRANRGPHVVCSVCVTVCRVTQAKV